MHYFKMGNGLLAGLVAITAPSGYVSPLFACIIGAIAGVNVVFFAGILEKVWKVDDPVGAIAVYGFNGAWGNSRLVSLPMDSPTMVGVLRALQEALWSACLC